VNVEEAFDLLVDGPEDPNIDYPVWRSTYYEDSERYYFPSSDSSPEMQFKEGYCFPTSVNKVTGEVIFMRDTPVSYDAFDKYPPRGRDDRD
jgi:hypothetical protein